MSRAMGWMVDRLAQCLSAREREAVLGDMAELGLSDCTAMLNLTGLIARRECARWTDWRPWLVAVCLIGPFATMLGLAALRFADESAIYVWLYADNWSWDLPRHAGFWSELIPVMVNMLAVCIVMACFAWTSGLVIAAAGNRTLQMQRALFVILLASIGFLSTSSFLCHGLLQRSRDFHCNAAVFCDVFYRLIFPAVTVLGLVLLPAMRGMSVVSRKRLFCPA